MIPGAFERRVAKVSLGARYYLKLPDLLGLTDIANGKTSAACAIGIERQRQRQSVGHCNRGAG
ncbi:hypothetical protein [Lysobacter gummosus]|nr:hypothetical protein [Lysobacter gummosus]UJQ30818.1 hypothetical protein L2D09_11915 [Lysobacter gummosus]